MLTHEKNIFNFFVLILISFPGIILTSLIFFSYKNSFYSSQSSTFWDQICELCFFHPFEYINIVLLLNLCIILWIISLAQKSTWLIGVVYFHKKDTTVFNFYVSNIDPYWTIIPVLLAFYFKYHPLAVINDYSSNISFLLVIIWSVRFVFPLRMATNIVTKIKMSTSLLIFDRLTHSYFRRERWQVGWREDWRFQDMRRDYCKHWWWSSFVSSKRTNSL